MGETQELERTCDLQYSKELLEFRCARHLSDLAGGGKDSGQMDQEINKRPRKDFCLLITPVRFLFAIGGLFRAVYFHTAI